jgi:hypothetical protein
MLTLSQTEYPPCAVFMLRGLDTQRACRLYDFTIAQLVRPTVAHYLAGVVVSGQADLVIESVRRDCHPRSKTPAFSPAM